MYSPKQKQEALDLWFAMYGEISIANFVEELGYPEPTTMARWIKSDPRYDPDRPTYKSKSILTKLEAIKRVADGEPARKVGRELGVTGVFNWVDKFAQGGTAALLPQPHKRKRKDEDTMARRRKEDGPRPIPLLEGPPPSAYGELPDDPEELKAMIYELRMDNDLLRGVLDVLKADRGCSPSNLSSAERAQVVSALEGRHELPCMRKRMGIPKSTYYYQLDRMTTPDEPDWLAEAVEQEFMAAHQSRGYRTVNQRLRLRAHPIVVSEKRVLAKMRQMDLRVCYTRKTRRTYSSYVGEIDDRPANIPLMPDNTHNFKASAPNELWVSDITEFRLPGNENKIYLSMIVDMFDGKPVGWSISTSPDSELANSSLLKATRQLKKGQHPICHTDGGAHYRWPGWKDICEEHGIIRSMSRKGCSADNAACEGFFGNLKNEMFYGRDWRGIDKDRFIEILDWWLHSYSTTRLKAFRENGKTVYDTIDNRRKRLGYM